MFFRNNNFNGNSEYTPGSEPKIWPPSPIRPILSQPKTKERPYLLGKSGWDLLVCFFVGIVTNPMALLGLLMVLTLGGAHIFGHQHPYHVPEPVPYCACGGVLAFNLMLTRLLHRFAFIRQAFFIWTAILSLFCIYDLSAGSHIFFVELE